MSKRIFTSESVTEGHPDKICDQISDGVLDAILAKDPQARVACECATTTGLVLVMGEITTNCYVDIAGIARDTITKIGYDNAEFGFDGRSCAVLTAIDKQSEDIAMGVDASYDDANQEGAGDQGMMFGFACNETDTLMPAPIYWAHQLSLQLARVRKDGVVDFFRPDGKTQVSFEYVDGKPVRISNVVVATQHAPQVSQDDLIEAVKREVIRPVLEPTGMFDEKNCDIFINTTGRFVVGGPMGDCGLTGRKLIQDSYGGMGSHGGGAFSGKDPSKVDRSAAYMCRWVAKHIVAAGLADKCELQVAYAIGYPAPVSIRVDTFGTGKVEEISIENALENIFSFKPADMVEQLNLLRPIYRKTTHYGHFTNPELPWEQLDETRLASLKQLLH